MDDIQLSLVYLKHKNLPQKFFEMSLRMQIFPSTLAISLDRYLSSQLVQHQTSEKEKVIVQFHSPYAAYDFGQKCYSKYKTAGLISQENRGLRCFERSCKNPHDNSLPVLQDFQNVGVSVLLISQGFTSLHSKR